MRNILLAAVAMGALATPALARDQQPYVGIEGGVIFPRDTELDVLIDDGTPDGLLGGVDAEYKKPGWEADGVIGYDFGPIRAEAEVGYKRLKTKALFLSPNLVDELGLPDSGPYDPGDLGFSDRTTVLSAMGNALVDLGDDNGFSIYAGGGAGRARVKMFSDKDSAWAWQLIGGVRYAISENVDIGLKYRYFQTGNLDFATPDEAILASGKLRTHSVLASLIFNFGGRAAEPAPPPPPAAPVEYTPPPPPPAPATQTCPDGTVIGISDTCPVPPPPPAPAPERG